MKRFFLFILIVALSFVFLQPVIAQTEKFRASEGSGEQTADGIVHTGACYITSILIITNGTDDATVILYDNTAASGTVRWEQTVAGANNYGGKDWSYPKFFAIGIYADVTGTGASYIVEKIPR